MSAFKFEGKTMITGITATRLPDTDKIKNAFEITGPSIERIVAICQSAVEANKWVELLSKNAGTSAIDIKRNTSFTSGANLNVSLKFLKFMFAHFYCTHNFIIITDSS